MFILSNWKGDGDIPKRSFRNALMFSCTELDDEI